MNKKKREGGLLTFFPWKEGGGGLLGRGGSVEMGSLIEDLLYICITVKLTMNLLQGKGIFASSDHAFSDQERTIFFVF